MGLEVVVAAVVVGWLLLVLAWVVRNLTSVERKKVISVAGVGEVTPDTVIISPPSVLCNSKGLYSQVPLSSSTSEAQSKLSSSFSLLSLSSVISV